MEHHPMHQKVAGSIPSQDAYRRQLIDASLSFSPIPVLKSINISSGEDFKKDKLKSCWDP